MRLGRFSHIGTHVPPPPLSLALFIPLLTFSLSLCGTGYTNHTSPDNTRLRTLSQEMREKIKRVSRKPFWEHLKPSLWMAHYVKLTHNHRKLMSSYFYAGAPQILHCWDLIPALPVFWNRNWLVSLVPVSRIASLIPRPQPACDGDWDKARWQIRVHWRAPIGRLKGSRWEERREKRREERRNSNKKMEKGKRRVRTRKKGR